MEKLFCPNCGQLLKENAQFCGNCGYNVEEYLQEQKFQQQANSNSRRTGVNNGQATDPETENGHENKQSTKRQKTPNQAKNRRSGGKKPKLWWVSGIIIVVLLLGGYLWGRSYYSVEKQVDRIVKTIPASSDFKNHVTTDDPSLKVSAANLKPTQKYFRTHKEELANLKSSLNNAESYHHFELQQDGHYFLVFPQYKIKVTAAYATLKTNHAGTRLYQGNKKVFTSKKQKKSYQVGPYFPGTYVFKAKGVVGGSEKQKSVLLDLMGPKRNVALALHDKKHKSANADKKDTDEEKDEEEEVEDPGADDEDDPSSRQYSVSTEVLNKTTFDGSIMASHKPSSAARSEYELDDQSGTGREVEYDAHGKEIASTPMQYRSISTKRITVIDSDGKKREVKTNSALVHTKKNITDYAFHNKNGSVSIARSRTDGDYQELLAK